METKDKELVIITTVGTSILENYKSASEKLGLENILLIEDIDSYKAPVKSNLFDEDEISDAIHIIKKEFFKGIVKNHEANEFEYSYNSEELNTEVSAEIKSLLHIYKKYKFNISEDNRIDNFKVYLLASDTVAGFLSAKLVKEWFELAVNSEIELDGEKFKLENIKIEFEGQPKLNENYIENLRTAGVNEDQIFKAFENLVERVKKIHRLYKKKKSENKKERKTNESVPEYNFDIIINITGGYKGFIPILTIIAQLEEFKLAYIYEQSNELIELTAFPITFNYDLALGIADILDNNIIKKLPDDIKETLRDYNLIDYQYQVSKFGQFLKDFIFKYDGIKKQELGYILEWFLYAYYGEKFFNEESNLRPRISDNIREKGQFLCFNTVDFSYTNRKECLDNEVKIGDVDLFLESNNEVIVCEVKSLNKITNKKFKADRYYKEQILPKVKIYDPNEFRFYIYRVGIKFNEPYDFKANTRLLNKLKKIAELFNNDFGKENKKFRVFTFELYLDKNLGINLTSLFQDPLSFEIEKLEFNND